MARIKVIQHEESEGELLSVYDDLLKSRGKLADVHKIQSLRPKSIVKHMDLYMEIMFTKSDLSRAKREMIAVVVSVNNDCLYCQTHHGEALNHYWKNDDRLAKLKSDFNSAIVIVYPEPNLVGFTSSIPFSFACIIAFSCALAW